MIYSKEVVEIKRLGYWLVVRDGCIGRKRVGSLVGGMNILDIQSVTLFSLPGVRRRKKLRDCRRDLQRTTMGLWEDSINCTLLDIFFTVNS